MQPERNAVCLCADARMMIPAMFVARSVLAMSPERQRANSFDVFIFTEASQVSDVQRDWMRENGILLRDDVDLSAYHAWFDPTQRLSAATLTRLFLPHLLPDHYRRILYLDADVTIHDDVSPIFSLDTGSHAFAAVRAAAIWDGREEERQDSERHLAELGMTRPYRYFNSGVLLIDRRNWLKQDLTRRTLEFIGANREICRLVDEDALNAVVDGDFREVSHLWNLRFDKRLDRLSSWYGWPVIVHHAGPFKPWRRFVRRRHLFADRYYYNLYRSFLKGSPWQGWLATQWTLRDLVGNIEWEIAEAVRRPLGRSKQLSPSRCRIYFNAIKRYSVEQPLADIEQGIVVRENGVLHLRKG